MFRSASNMGGFIFKLAFALILVAVFAVVITRLFQYTLIVEVTDCSLTSNTIANNGLTTITFTVKNNDENDPHDVKVEFSSHPLVMFMLGSQNLPKENDVWYYTETLNPTASHTQSINVGASLESGIAKLDYRITVNFYVDGKQSYDKNFDLTVQR